MRIIQARNVNYAWPQAIELVLGSGVSQETRAGVAFVHPEPVATVYQRPLERVIFDPVRDANPIFHHMESLWMLAGRDDATWLDQFVSDFSKRFAEDGGRMHGAYGKRWRDWFNGRPHPDGTALMGRMQDRAKIDQLDEAVRVLREDPQSRQVVISMWDPSADLGVPGLKDRPCNTQIYLRTDRTVLGPRQGDNGIRLNERVLDMTVTCRSNDAVYGAYGANAYHMSILQEYLAARIGVEVGTYTQFSNNLHIYDWSMDRVDIDSARGGMGDGYPEGRRLVDDPESFDEELRAFLEKPSGNFSRFNNSHFHLVAQPLWAVNHFRLGKKLDVAYEAADGIHAMDLRVAVKHWLKRRMKGQSSGRETRE